MLVLRKEIKLGLGIGAAVLGIAMVYGLMAMLSANSRTPGQATATDEIAPAVADGGSASGDAAAVTGLPPKEESKPKAPVQTAGDPFAESMRSDGNKSDPWTEALNTGNVPADTNIVSVKADRNSSPIQTQAGGTAETQNDLNGPIITQAPTKLTADPGPERSNVGGSDGHHDSSTNTASASATSAGTYTVQSGDTFTRIAAKLYGDRRLASALIKANPTIEPTRLRAGVAIAVPAKDEVTTARGALPPVGPTLTGAIDSSRQYRIAPGDTLNRIAVKLYGHAAMWEAIYDANKATIGADPGRIKIGQVLTLSKAPTHVGV